MENDYYICSLLPGPLDDGDGSDYFSAFLPGLLDDDDSDHYYFSTWPP